MRPLHTLLVLVLTSCAQQAPPPAPAKPPLELIGEWGTRGDGPGQLKTPVSIGTDFAGNVYVADAGNGYIHKFDPLGKPLLSFNDPLLKSPRGVAVDGGGGIYVVDSAGNQVFIFKPDGERFARVRRSSRGALRQPFGVAVSVDGTFYVTDAAGVNRFNGRLRGLNSWGILGDSPLPKEWVSAVALGPEGAVYVTDPRGAIVQRFGPEGLGQEHAIFASDTPPDGAARAVHNSGVAASDRLVFLLDEPSAQLVIWSSEGAVLLKRRFNDLLPGGAGLLVNLAWSPKGELFLLDQANARVLRFRVNL